MQIIKLGLSGLFLILFLSGCKTTRVIQPVGHATDNITRSSSSISGFTVLPVTWINDNPDTMRKNIVRIVEKAAAEKYNSLFFQIGEESEAYLPSVSNPLSKISPEYSKHEFDPLSLATDLAHKNNLKIFAGIDLSEFSDEVKDLPAPQAMTRMKTMVRNLVAACDIDGLYLTSGNSSPDLIEELVVEAMLIKPYLIRLLASPVENGCQNGIGCLETATPEQVIGLDLSALFPDNPGGQTVYINNRSKTRLTDSEGYIGFIASISDTIKLETAKGIFMLPTGSWSLPYKYSLLPDNKLMRKAPWVELRSNPGKYSEVPVLELLYKTEYPAMVRINNVPVKQYKTGIFFKKITLNEGLNRIRATVMTPDSLPAFYESEISYYKTDRSRKTFPLWIDEKTIEPSSGLELLPEDLVTVSFQGSLGQEGYVELTPGRFRIKCSKEDHTDYSLYRCEIPLRRLKTGKQYKITLRLNTSGANEKQTSEFVSKHLLTVREPEDFPYVRVTKENSRLTYNTGAPRLGGPIRSELGPGVVMKTNGKTGEYYRIRLSRNENGIISSNDVELMAEGTVKPSYYITSMSCGPSKDADILTIPYPEPVPYEVYPDPDQKRIVITLFGVETSSTWITHREGRKIIDKVTWQQITPETYQIFVNLKKSEIWGYTLKQEGKMLVLRLRYAPVYNLKSEKPLAGLKIAIEAGHGGSGTGAIGLSGLVEKDINLDLSLRLGELCRSMGADIVQVRDSDKDIAILKKRNIAETSGANLLICIHANAGGGGYLQVGGTSTYYNNPFWAPLAESIYKRLLELNLKEFGEVGSFNYTVIRVSMMPAILVEQAFMTNAEDEENLADPEFRQQMAGKIYQGIIDYLEYMN